MSIPGRPNLLLVALATAMTRAACVAVRHRETGRPEASSYTSSRPRIETKRPGVATLEHEIVLPETVNV